jgi:ABC-type uncharacterized transport system permease subunit
MLVFVTWITLSVIVGIAASRHFNRDGFGWALASAIVSPLITFLLLAALGPKATVRRQSSLVIEQAPAINLDGAAVPLFFIVVAVLGVIGLLALIIHNTV